jgi:hypothetical protein
MKPSRPYLVWPYAKRSKLTCSTNGKDSPDAVPARILWVEIATRITTKPLHYRSGDEEAAAESIYSLFPKARELMEEHPDAKAFSEIALKLLNEALRPYTARWHGWMTNDGEEEGGPRSRFRDEVTRRLFRTELRELQPRLIGYEKAFKALSEGSRVKAEWLEPDQSATDALRTEWQHTGKTACLGKRPLKAGIGPQVPVQGGFPNAVATTDIDRKEHEFILRRRDICDPEHRLPADGKLADAIGLALSGGGIRSATVCLGVVQVLARQKLFAEIDYLSTVSGGGYFGSFLSSCLGPDQQGQVPATKKTVDNLIKETFEADTHGTEAGAVRHLRNNSKYLLSGGLWGKLKMAGLMISGLITNLLMILPVPLFAAILIWLLNFCGFWGGAPFTQKAMPFASLNSFAGWILISSLCLLLLLWFFLPAIQKTTLGKPPDSRATLLRRYWTIVTLALAVITAAIFALFGLPAIFHWYGTLKDWLDHFDGLLSRIKPENALVVLLAALPFLFGAAARFFERPWIRNLLGRLFILSGPVFFGWVILFVGAKIGLATGAAEWQWGWVAGVTVAWLVWSFLFVDINTLGPHGYYRDRLCECYLAYRGENQITWWQTAIRQFWGGRRKRREAKKAQEIGLAPQIAARLRLPLSQMGTPGAAPYHLINCVVNLPASANPDLRGRNGDFFIISPFFCGSPICGYVATSQVERADPHVDLGTAMAISGAAASTNMGWRTLPNYRFLMALFNVRLGYWLPNVRRLDQVRVRGVGPAYFLAEISGRIQENIKHLNVSDGGHIENLGVYELLRRRCKFIICVDGGANLGTEGSDLQRLERYALIDLGIKFEYNLADLQPNKDGISRAYAILIKILYKPGEAGCEEVGWMIYLKPALTGAEPQYVLDYRYRNSSFPHEGILDQIFEEEQFEGYRAVGECAAESLFRAEIVGNTRPQTVRAWFQKLADSLLPDNDPAFFAEDPDQARRPSEAAAGLPAGPSLAMHTVHRNPATAQ